jgi:hypothetical protein
MPRRTPTFAVNPFGIDVGVRGLVEGFFGRAVDVFDFENAAAATSSVGV